MLAELQRGSQQGVAARPVIIGPITFLALSKAVGRRDRADCAARRADSALHRSCWVCSPGPAWQWVQLDEPVLVTDILDNGPELAERTYTALGAHAERPAIFVATYFGGLDAALPALAAHTDRGHRHRPGRRRRSGRRGGA